MNLSVWDSTYPRKYNPSLSSAHVITEFERTKKQKIFAHKLGRVSFGSKDINSPRDRVIEIQNGNLDLDGFKYKNVGHTYLESVVTPIDEELGGYPVYAHGHPLGGTEHGGLESCARMGLSCKDGEGTDQLCNPGKCVIGKISRVRNKKWKYESINQYVSDEPSIVDFPLIYYVNGEKEVSLHTILRGKIKSYSGNNPVTLSIDSPASKYTKIYLPPKYYFSEDFIDGALKVIDTRLNEVRRKPQNNVIGVENRKDRFVSSFISLVYPDKSDEYLSIVLYEDGTRLEVKNTMLSVFSTLPNEWYLECENIIEDEYLYRELNSYNNLDFICAVFDRIKDIFNCVVQVTKSSIKRANLDFYKDQIARPVYSRLPGVSEGYRSDPLSSEDETPAQWLTSGVDEFLSRKKDQIASFYRDYLDPETCSPLVLDWLAQHVGLFGSLWDERWDRTVKVAMIQNAFGWYNRDKTVSIPGVGNVKTPKGEALSKFPFNSSPLWTSDPTQDNSLKICTNETQRMSYNFETGRLEDEFVFTEKVFNEEAYTLSLNKTNTIKIYDGKWNGLMEAKGSILSFAFLSSVFNLKSHVSQEIEIRDTATAILDDNTIYEVLVTQPKDGLRNAEISAPPLWPYKSEILQVGGETIDTEGNVTGNDLKINNYANQIVAGVSRVTTLEDSKNVFFRVPYYYNRDGKSWDRTKYIADNWLPDNLNKRVQYAYLSADLWAVGDGFFEPTLDESILNTPLVTSEGERNYIVTEDRAPLQREYVL